MNDKLNLTKLKIKNTYSFYVSDVNKTFFDVTTKKYKNNLFYKRLISDIRKNKCNNDIKEIFDIENINNVETFQNLLNKILIKINSIIGDKNNPILLFKSRNELGNPLYVAEDNENYDLKILGNKSFQKKYMFKIDINPNSYLSMYAESIEIVFCFDEKTKMVSGAFSVNQSLNSVEGINKNKLYEKIFLNNLQRYFLENEFKKISFTNLLQLFDDLKIVKEDTEISFNSKLKKHWNSFIDKKFSSYINLSNVDLKTFTDDLFNSIFVTQIIMLAIYEEFKNYLKSLKPSLVLNSINNYENLVNLKDNSSSNRDLINLIIFAKNKYAHLPEINLDEIETADEAFKIILDYSKFESHSLWHSIPSYEIETNFENIFFNNHKDIFLKNNDLKLFFLFTMYPQLFGLEINNTNFSTIDEVTKIVKNIIFDDHDIQEFIVEKLDEIICETSCYYISFINPSLSSLIVKNANLIDGNWNDNLKSGSEYSNFYDLSKKYLWSIIYIQSRVWKLMTIDKALDKEKNFEPWKLRNRIYEMNNLQIDTYGDFYGLPIEKIVKNMEKHISLSESITLLTKKLNRDDQRYGKSKERNYLTIGVIAASAFGILDFFTTTFSILTVSSNAASESLKHPLNLIVIGIGSFFAFILLLIGVLALCVIIRSDIKQKKG
ncbi:MPN337 family protein [Mycoplasmoides alvi]|uniref:MPN337 family protein n=1 Tax=Mycoplasmoides alvi TaxID=78580 RepID=UPI000AE0C894|nr:hypothetical protein [Mycoplasmoides alvi]